MHPMVRLAGILRLSGKDLTLLSSRVTCQVSRRSHALESHGLYGVFNGLSIKSGIAGDPKDTTYVLTCFNGMEQLQPCF